MKYPFLLYGRKIDHAPIFPDLKGDPYVLDLSHRNAMLSEMDERDQRTFQLWLDNDMQQADRSWGFSGYLERRDSLLRSCPQMVEEKRFFHLGLDIIVPLGTLLHAPLDAVVEEAGYEEGEGNYGGFVLLKHEGENFRTFFSFYGHLSPDSLAEKGTRISAGDSFAAIGDFHENGNWFYHTHLQVITRWGLENGYISKGYASASDLGEMEILCPSPMSLFTRR